MLFQFRGRGHPQDDATPNFCADSFTFNCSTDEVVTINHEIYIELYLKSEVVVKNYLFISSDSKRPILRLSNEVSFVPKNF